MTICVRAFRHVVEELKLPRAVVTRHPMGRPLGAPGDGERHRRVLRAAVELLASSGRQIVELPDAYRVPEEPDRTGDGHR